MSVIFHSSLEQLIGEPVLFGERTIATKIQDTDNTVEDERERLCQQAKALDVLLQSWLDVDEAGVAEQRETLEILMRALNDDRRSDGLRC